MHLLTAIHRRVGRAVENVEVALLENTVIVRGKVNSYYNWQLIHAACVKAMSIHPGYDLDCAIVVSHNHG